MSKSVILTMAEFDGLIDNLILACELKDMNDVKEFNYKIWSKHYDLVIENNQLKEYVKELKEEINHLDPEWEDK